MRPSQRNKSALVWIEVRARSYRGHFHNCPHVSRIEGCIRHALTAHYGNKAMPHCTVWRWEKSKLKSHESFQRLSHPGWLLIPTSPISSVVALLFSTSTMFIFSLTLSFQRDFGPSVLPSISRLKHSVIGNWTDLADPDGRIFWDAGDLF